MTNEAMKLKMIGILVGILCGSKALSAQEARILTGVYTKLPQVTDMKDREEIADFMEKNYGRLSPETIGSLKALIGVCNVSHAAKEFSAYTSGFDSTLSRSVMCMVD